MASRHAARWRWVHGPVRVRGGSIAHTDGRMGRALTCRNGGLFLRPYRSFEVCATSFCTSLPTLAVVFPSTGSGAFRFFPNQLAAEDAIGKL